MKQLLRKLWHDESGQDLAEYTMLIVLIAIACIGAVTALGGGVQSGLEEAAGVLSGGGGSGSGSGS
jgi:Flp pilus assembly pilin Flp